MKYFFISVCFLFLIKPPVPVSRAGGYIMFTCYNFADKSFPVVILNHGGNFGEYFELTKPQVYDLTDTGFMAVKKEILQAEIPVEYQLARQPLTIRIVDQKMDTLFTFGFKVNIGKLFKKIKDQISGESGYSLRSVLSGFEERLEIPVIQ